MDMNSYAILKQGSNVLNSKCQLKLIVERNMDSWKSQNVPDISVSGVLSRLEAVLGLQQYQLVRGFLSYNLGECIDDLNVEATYNNSDSRSNLLAEVIVCELSGHSATKLNRFFFLFVQKIADKRVWTNMSITLDLQDVSVQLTDSDSITNDPSPLARINFIKSSLKIDSFSDGSQDIDLVSQEILVIDSRCANANDADRPKNAFTNILQPINAKLGQNSVQAEVHSRRRNDSSKFTILLNNMRVMAIIDWLEMCRDFLSQNPEKPKDSITVHKVNEHLATPVPEDPIEVVLNITDSELVFVETPDQWDTNAVILKSTTILSYRPVEVDKVMSINLNNLEVFSCVLGIEEETALSIIDPVTINMDLKKNVLDIQLAKRLSIRLSYNDLKMVSQMIQSLPGQTKNAKSKNQVAIDSAERTADPQMISKLSALGFNSDDCIHALDICSNQLDEAALWLTQHAEPTKMSQTIVHPLEIKAITVQANCISLCVIDDCKDADVPLLEMSLSELKFDQELSSSSELMRRSNSSLIHDDKLCFKTGSVKGTFASDYYNRGLSGWEPLIEPWKCDATWSYSLGSSGMQRNRLKLKLNSEDMLKFNVTSTSIELYQIVHTNWTQDYYGQPMSISTNQKTKRRSPFVPFAIRNQTGVRLWFALTRSETPLASSDTRWTPLEPNAVTSFSFGPPSKQRHLDTHKLSSHQIGVRVEGWSEVGPVSIDRVGVFFRHARYEAVEFVSMPRARIVFSVTLEGSAHKLVTVRSALRLNNKLDRPILLRMEHDYRHLSNPLWPAVYSSIVPTNEVYSVPLNRVHSLLSVRPLSTEIDLETTQKELQQQQLTDAASNVARDVKFNGKEYWNRYESSVQRISTNSFQFCKDTLNWKEMSDGAELTQELRTCISHREKFRFVAGIRREGYPTKDAVGIPGHSITLWPPLRLNNLLPCDLLYKLVSGTQGRIASSETASVHEVDLERELSITLTLDGYPGAGTLIIPSGFSSNETTLRLTDVKQRILNLRATVTVMKGLGMQISVYAPYWLVNRTGLPLVFRQEGVSHESAGQFQENEQGRLVSPLMYSISDHEASPALTVRLGKRFGQNPPWCQPFQLHKDILNRQLKSGSSNETFILGIEVRRGRGRYIKTSVVTFSPRFQLYNRSSYKLQFAQKYYATTLTDPLAKATFIEAVPGCHLPFHWPRLDKDQLLCIRLPDVENCLWSGGIPIHETQSLNINIRNTNGHMHFIRVEIVLQGATYFLLFGDAQALPPPIRIDNYSDVPMKFYQTDCRNQCQTIVRVSAISMITSVNSNHSKVEERDHDLWRLLFIPGG